MSILAIAREVRNFTGLDISETREILEYLIEGESDFNIGGYRFIHYDHIDRIMQDELSNDNYVLGCFNADFLSGILGIDADIIKGMQGAGNYEHVGMLVQDLGKLKELQAQHASLNSYGVHFGIHDGNYSEIEDYYIFRVN